MLVVVILHAGDTVAFVVGKHARHVAERPDLGALLARALQMRPQRLAVRPDRAPDMTPAVIEAGRTALVFGAVDAGRHWASGMLWASKASRQISPCRKLFSGGIG